MKTAIQLLCISYLLSAIECASVASRSGFDSRPTRIYPGAVLDARLVADPYYINFSETGRHPNRLALGPRLLSILDFPLSAILDTISLPYDIYTWAEANDAKHSNEGHKDKSEPQPAARPYGSPATGSPSGQP